MGGKSQQSTSQVTIPPEVLARYNAVNAQAQQVAQTPFQTYSTDPNAFVAGLTPEQQAGMSQTAAYAQSAQPWIQQAGQYTAAGAGAVDPSQITGQTINQYMNPYTQDVTGQMARLMNQQFQQAQSGQMGQAIQSGAFGGDRSGIAAANLQGQQALAFGNAMAPVLQQGYNTALSTAQQQQGVDLAAQQANMQRLQAAGAQLGQLGTAAQTAGLSGAQAMMGAGQTAQQTQQAGLTALYNQFLQQQSYPFQTTQFLANIAEGTGALSGQTTQSTQPAPFFSDKRLKTDIKRVGTAKNGLPIHSFRYKDDPEKLVRLGFMADDVEDKHPDAVGLAGGYKTIDYDKAIRATGGSVQDWNQGESYERGGLQYGGSYDPSWQSVGQREASMFGQSGAGAPGLDPYGGVQRHVPKIPQAPSHRMLTPTNPPAPAQGAGAQAMQGLGEIEKLAGYGEKAQGLYNKASSALGGGSSGASSTGQQAAPQAAAGAPAHSTSTDDPTLGHGPAGASDAAPAQAAPSVDVQQPPHSDSASADTPVSSDAPVQTADVLPQDMPDFSSFSDVLAGARGGLMRGHFDAGGAPEGFMPEEQAGIRGIHPSDFGAVMSGAMGGGRNPTDIPALNMGYQNNGRTMMGYGPPSQLLLQQQQGFSGGSGAPAMGQQGGASAGLNAPAPQASANALATQQNQGYAGSGVASPLKSTQYAPADTQWINNPALPPGASPAPGLGWTPSEAPFVPAGLNPDRPYKPPTAANLQSNYSLTPDLGNFSADAQAAVQQGGPYLGQDMMGYYYGNMGAYGTNPAYGSYAEGGLAGRDHFDAGGAGSTNSSGASDAGDPEGLYGAEGGMDIPNQAPDAKLPDAPKPPQQSGGGGSNPMSMLGPLMGLLMMQRGGRAFARGGLAGGGSPDWAGELGDAPDPTGGATLDLPDKKDPTGGATLDLPDEAPPAGAVEREDDDDRPLSERPGGLLPQNPPLPPRRPAELSELPDPFANKAVGMPPPGSQRDLPDPFAQRMLDRSPFGGLAPSMAPDNFTPDSGAPVASTAPKPGLAANVPVPKPPPSPTGGATLDLPPKGPSDYSPPITGGAAPTGGLTGDFITAGAKVRPPPSRTPPAASAGVSGATSYAPTTGAAAAPASRAIGAAAAPSGRSYQAAYGNGITGILGYEEGFRPKAYLDTDGQWTIGYGSKYFTDANGNWRRVQQGDVTSQAGAQNDMLSRLTNEFVPKAQSAVGWDTWKQLPRNIRESLTSITWNYGHLPDSVAQAARTMDPRQIANAVLRLGGGSQNLDVLRARRSREAGFILGGGQ